MASKLIWNSSELEKEVQAEMKPRLKEAAIIIRDSARSKVSVSAEPHVFRGETYQPGSLEKSIGYKVITEGVYKDEIKARIGTSLVYGIFQELGPVTGKTSYYRSSKRIEAHREWKFKPWLRPAFHEKEAEIKETLGVGRNILGRTKGTSLKPADILL